MTTYNTKRHPDIISLPMENTTPLRRHYGQSRNLVQVNPLEAATIHT